MRPLTKQAEARKRLDIGKLVVFAGAEAGVGRALCAANVAAVLARKSRCLALDLDQRSHDFQTHLGMPSVARGIAEFLNDTTASLESIQCKTRVRNLQCVGWAASGAAAVAFGTLKIDALLRSLQSHPVDYVVAALQPGTTDDTLELFAAADVPVLVTRPTSAVLTKAIEFLGHCAARGFGERRVYVILNRVQRGGEEKEAAAFVEEAKQNLGLNISIMGSILYDPQFESSCRQGNPISQQQAHRVTSLAFEDIARRIERLLPRSRPEPVTAVPPVKKSPGIPWFGGKRRLQEQLQQKDQAFRRLQQQHRAEVDDLQQIIGNKSAEIAECESMIGKLEEDFRIQTDDLAEKFKRIETLEGSVLTLRRELEQRHEHVEHLRGSLDQTAGRLAEAEEHIREQASVVDEKTRAILDLEERFAQLAAEQRAIANRATDALHQLTSEIRTEHSRALQQKDTNIHELTERLAQLTAEQGIVSNRATDAVLELSGEIRVHRDETIRGLTDVQQTFRERDTFLKGKDHKISELADRLAQLTAEREASSNRTTDTLWALSAEIRDHRDQTVRGLGEVRQTLAEREAAVEKTLERKDEEIHELAKRLAQLTAEHAAVSTQSALTLRQLSELIRSHRDETVRSLTDVQKTFRERDTFLEEKDREFLDFTERLGQLTAEHGVVSTRTTETLRELSEEIRLQRATTAQGLTEVEKSVRDGDALLERKDAEIRELAERLTTLLSEHGATANRTEEALQRMSGEIGLQRNDIVRGLAETEKRVLDRDALLQEKNQELHAADERAAQLASEQRAFDNRTLEALQRLSRDLRIQREESAATIETYKNLAAGIDDRTDALVLQLSDAARQKDNLMRQMEESLRREVADLQGFQREKELAVRRLEEAIRVLEKDNYQLKVELMSAVEKTATTRGPEVLSVQRDVLIQALRLHPAQSITLIAMNEAGTDGFDFAIEMRSILESSGWRVRYLSSPMDKAQFYGLQLVTDGSDAASSAARILSEAFGKGRLRFAERTVPSPNNLDALRLIIGRSNW